MSKSNFFTRFDPPPSAGVSAEGGLTDQHFKEECDLNVILRKYRATGIPAPAIPARFEDLTVRPVDLLDAWERIQDASDWFDSLPSDVRSKFQNDPRQALRLVMSDHTAAIAAGLLPASEDNHSQAVDTATPEPAPAKPEKEPAKPPAPAA